MRKRFALCIAVFVAAIGAVLGILALAMSDIVAMGKAQAAEQPFYGAVVRVGEVTSRIAFTTSDVTLATESSELDRLARVTDGLVTEALQELAVVEDVRFEALRRRAVPAEEGQSATTVADLTGGIRALVEGLQANAVKAVALTRSSLEVRRRFVEAAVELSKLTRAQLAWATLEPKGYATLLRGVVLMAACTDQVSVMNLARPNFNKGADAVAEALERTQDQAGKERLAALRKSFEDSYALGREALTAKVDQSVIASRSAKLIGASSLAALLTYSQDQAGLAAQAVARQTSTALRMAVAVAALGTCLAVLYVVLVLRQVLRGIDGCVQAIRAIAAGDFHRAAPTDGVTEVRQMGEAINATAARLATLIGRIGHHAETLSVASDHLHDLGGELQQNVSSSAQEVTAVQRHSQEIASQVTAVAAALDALVDALHHAGAKTQAATQTAQEASVSAQRIDTAIQDLNQAGGEVAAATVLIANIARRTNLIALNAAIEASSAGVAGRGFVVVANEVKYLAQQAAEATRTITHAIERMRARVDGLSSQSRAIVDVVVRVDSTQQEIAAQVSAQADAAGGMAERARHAAAAAEAIHQRVDHVARHVTVTQASAAGSAAASAQLAGLVQDMRHMIQNSPTTAAPAV